MIDLSIGTIGSSFLPGLDVAPSCRYAPRDGLPALRELIASVEHVPYESVLVTAGAASGLSACFSLSTPGKVLLPRPYFSPYLQLARFFGHEPIYYDASDVPDHSMVMRLANLVDETCHCIVWNYPHNPTGNLDHHLDLSILAEKCSKVGALLINDRVYNKLLLGGINFDGHRPLLPSEIRIHSFSKAYGLAGERVGYALAEKQMCARLRDSHWSLVGSTSWAGQLMAIEALKSDGRAWLDSTLRSLSRMRDLVSKQLASIPRLVPNLPDAGVFFWVQIQELSGQRFISELLDRGVVVAPGHMFGDESGQRFRMCFALPENVMAKALTVFRATADCCQQRLDDC
ncbi:MAG TPA: pyridoxal phosphate-dependent aminotransferase [Pyrinomonadaceae bacterium]|jgi:aspartate/methionine/tyrosine aminotransferase